MSQTKALLQLEAFLVLPSLASFFNISSTFEYNEGSNSQSFSNRYEPIVKTRTRKINQTARTKHSNKSTNTFDKKENPENWNSKGYFGIQKVQNRYVHWMKMVVFLTWTFWWISCLSTSIVGPILSTKEQKQEQEILITKLKFPRLKKREKNEETNQELEEPSCRYARKA